MHDNAGISSLGTTFFLSRPGRVWIPLSSTSGRFFIRGGEEPVCSLLAESQMVVGVRMVGWWLGGSKGYI